MKLRQVNPKLIQVPAVRVTSAWDSEALQEFKRSISTMGILEPLVCVESDGNLILVDGLHRLVEAQEEHKKQVPVVVIPGSEVDVFLQNLVLNNLRGRTKATELAAVFKHLFEEYNLGVDEISSRTGYSQERISKLLYISRAHPDVLQALDEDLIGVGHAFALARIQDPDVQQRILSTQLTYRFKVKDLEDHITNVLGEKQRLIEAPTPAPLQELPAIKCHFCGRATPIDHVANPNICVGCQGALYDMLKAAAYERQQAVAAAEELTSAEK